MFKTAKNTALRILARKACFEVELKRKLQARSLPDDAIAYAIEECKKYGYLDDGERVQSVVRREMQKGKGPHYIAAKFKMLGISPSALHALYSRESEIEQIRKILQKRSTPKDPRRLVMHLRRRGFSLDIIRKVIL